MIAVSDLIANPLYQLYTMGGEILGLLMLFALLMWLLIIERYLYFSFSYKDTQRRYLLLWQTTRSKIAAQRQLIKSYYLSEYSLQSERGIAWIQVLIKVSLLLGLLGTVLGLISVFEAQLYADVYPNRLFSNSIAQAIIPTTAGLFVSLSGVYFANHLKRLAANSRTRLDRLLT